MDAVINLLKMYPRGRKEALLIEEYFTHHFSYVQVLQSKLERQFYLKIFQELTFETFLENTTIFEAGEVGRKMYFILEGEVAILMPKNPQSTRQQCQSKSIQDTIDTAYRDFKMIVKLRSGQHFGEIALQNKVLRTASILCTTKVVIASLSYRNYQDIIRQAYIQINKSKMEFLQKISIFNGWPSGALSILMRYLEERDYPAFSYIYKHSQPINYIYFIVSGVVQVEVFNYVQPFEILAKKQKQTLQTTQLSDMQHFGEYEIFHHSDLIDKVGDLNKKLRQYSRCSDAQTTTQTKVFKLDIYQFIENYHIFSDIELAKINFKNITNQRQERQNNRDKIMNQAQNKSIQTEDIYPEQEMKASKSPPVRRGSRIPFPIPIIPHSVKVKLSLIESPMISTNQSNQGGFFSPERIKHSFGYVQPQEQDMDELPMRTTAIDLSKSSFVKYNSKNDLSTSILMPIKFKTETTLGAFTSNPSLKIRKINDTRIQRIGTLPLNRPLKLSEDYSAISPIQPRSQQQFKFQSDVARSSLLESPSAIIRKQDKAQVKLPLTLKIQVPLPYTNSSSDISSPQKFKNRFGHFKHTTTLDNKHYMKERII